MIKNVSFPTKNCKKKKILLKTVIFFFFNVHYIAKSIGSPPSNERFDYFSNFHEYKS